MIVFDAFAGPLDPAWTPHVGTWQIDNDAVVGDGFLRWLGSDLDGQDWLAQTQVELLGVPYLNPADLDEGANVGVTADGTFDGFAMCTFRVEDTTGFDVLFTADTGGGRIGASHGFSRARAVSNGLLTRTTVVSQGSRTRCRFDPTTGGEAARDYAPAKTSRTPGLTNESGIGRFRHFIVYRLGGALPTQPVAP